MKTSFRFESSGFGTRRSFYYFRFEGFNFGMRKIFYYIVLIPTIDVTIDRQMEERLIASDSSIHGGYVEYSIGIMWLAFSIQMTMVRSIC